MRRSHCALQHQPPATSTKFKKHIPPIISCRVGCKFGASQANGQSRETCMGIHGHVSPSSNRKAVNAGPPRTRRMVMVGTTTWKCSPGKWREMSEDALLPSQNASASLRRPERAQGSENKLCGFQPVPSLLSVQSLFPVKGENHTSPQDYKEDQTSL